MTSLHKLDIELAELLPVITEQLHQGKNVTFSPMGISMLPMLRQGKDSVVLSPVPEKLSKYDLPLYRRDNLKFVLHRIVKTGETYTCIGDNQFVYEKGIRHDQIIGVVSGFYRNKKYHSTDEFSYRCYCAFWHHTRRIRHFYRRGRSWLGRHLR